MRQQLIQSGVLIGLALVLLWISAGTGRRFVSRASKIGDEARGRATTLWLVLKRLIFGTVILVAVLMLFTVWEMSLAPFLAVGTVLAAALGFGAQAFVRDVIAGFFILAENQYRIGDTVTIVETTGTVEDVQLRVTVLRDFEGNVHFVPNGQITVTSNMTSQFAMPVLDMAIGYDVDVDHAMAVMADEVTSMSSDPEWAASFLDPPEVLGVQRLDDSAVIVRVKMYTLAAERWRVRREALRRLKKRLDSEGITIPFPQITVNRADGEGEG